MNEHDPPLEDLVGNLPPSLARSRIAAARDEAAKMALVAQKVAQGSSKRSALMAVFPGKSRGNLNTRYNRFVQGGVAALLNAHHPTPRIVLTRDVRQRIHGMVSMKPEVTTRELVETLARSGVVVGHSTVDEFRREAGIAMPKGPRSASVTRSSATPLQAAGGMLLIAAEMELGAVRALTSAAGTHLGGLAGPENAPLDDRSNRDEMGRFTSEYNKPRERTSPELGSKFDTFSRHASEKDLTEMRTANASFEARYRKDVSLMLLPLFVSNARWSSLRYWSGEGLGELSGFAYQPATLDKYARELKLSGASEAMRGALASFWLNEHAEAFTPQEGCVLVYIDGVVKPVWTGHYSKSAKISKNGRSMPATSTIQLHLGTGTPVVYRSFSGTASLCKEATSLLADVERATGGGTVKRMVVMDREAHSVALFKELIDKNWDFIVPLRSNVTGPLACLEDSPDWKPYLDTKDELLEATITLKDRRKGEKDLELRVVGRRRASTGKTFWLATPTAEEVMGSNQVVNTYFDRWPLQELVFRDGNKRVGLDVHHGYGKQKITNVAVIDRITKDEAAIVAGEERLRSAVALLATLREAQAQATAKNRILGVEIRKLEARRKASHKRGADLERFASILETLCDARSTQSKYNAQLHRLEKRRVAADSSVSKLTGKLAKLRARLSKNQECREIFTVDVELDEIMTSYKLTFMNLSAHVMDRYFQGRMALDTLIESVFTLPGERLLTATEEVIRIYHQPRDIETMKIVEEACARVNELRLRRDKRVLKFELTTGPKS